MKIVSIMSAPVDGAHGGRRSRSFLSWRAPASGRFLIPQFAATASTAALPCRPRAFGLHRTTDSAATRTDAAVRS